MHQELQVILTLICFIPTYYNA